MAISLAGAVVGLVLGALASELVVRALAAATFVTPDVSLWVLARGLLVGFALGVIGALFCVWQVHAGAAAQSDEPLSARELDRPSCGAPWRRHDPVQLHRRGRGARRNRRPDACERGDRVRTRGRDGGLQHLRHRSGGDRQANIARGASARACARRPTPGDWVYLHNFKDPRRPIAVALPAVTDRAPGRHAPIPRGRQARPDGGVRERRVLAPAPRSRRTARARAGGRARATCGRRRWREGSRSS